MDDDVIERIWAIISEKQRSINKQAAESEKRFNRELEESNRIVEDNERKYFKRADKKNLELKEVDKKIYEQLENKKIKLEEIKERSTDFIKDKKVLKKLKQLKKWKNKNGNDETAQQPDILIYSAIINLFNEQGYNFDDATLQKYWTLVTSFMDV